MLRILGYYQRLGLDDLMRITIDSCLKMAETLEGKKSDEYADALLYAAFIQEKKGDALLMIQQAAEIFEELHGVNSENYKQAQKALALFGATPQIGVTHSELDKYKEQYGENSTTYFHEYVNYLSSLGNHYQESKDIDNLYKTSIEIDSLSQVIYSTFSKKEECYIWARHNLAELVVDIFDMCLNTNFYNRSIDIQKDVVSASLSLYGEDNIKYIREVEQLAQIMSHFPTMYFYVHEDEYDKISNLSKANEGRVNFSEAWNYYKSTSLHQCFEDIIKHQQIAVDYYKKGRSMENHNYARACAKLADYYAEEISVFPLHQ